MDTSCLSGEQAEWRRGCCACALPLVSEAQLQPLRLITAVLHSMLQCNTHAWAIVCTCNLREAAAAPCVPALHRWAFPQLAAMTLIFIHYTSAFCSSPVLYPACGLPAVSCGACHMVLLLGTFLLVGHQLYQFDLARRIAWYTAHRGRLPPSIQLATDRPAYWLNFGLPAVCCIFSYSTSLPALPSRTDAGTPTT